MIKCRYEACIITFIEIRIWDIENFRGQRLEFNCDNYISIPFGEFLWWPTVKLTLLAFFDEVNVFNEFSKTIFDSHMNVKQKI